VRLKSLNNEITPSTIKVPADLNNHRLKENQLVITKDGIGAIKGYTPKFDEHGVFVKPQSVGVYIRNSVRKNRMYKLTEIMVVDIIDNKTGEKFPALESDYNILILDDAPVKYRVTRKNKALIIGKSRKQLSICKMFTKKQNGIKIFNQLIETKQWNPIGK